MQTRVTLASPTPIDDSVVAVAEPTRVVAYSSEFGHAVHAWVDTDDPETLRGRLREAAPGVASAVIDGELVEGDARLLMLDVDSTLTTTEAIDLLAEHAGKGAEVAAITEAAMRGELDFEASLRRRVATLAGLPTSILDDVYPLMRLAPGAEALLDVARRRGVRVGVTSGGFTQLVDRLADDLGLDFRHANTLATVRRDGREVFTGEVDGTVVDRDRKSLDLRAFAAREGIPLSRSVAVGDGANDLRMLATAALGIAYRAKPVTAAQADAAIDFPRFDAVAAFALPSLAEA